MSRLVYCDYINDIEIYKIEPVKNMIRDYQDEIIDLKETIKNPKKNGVKMRKERNTYFSFTF